MKVINLPRLPQTFDYDCGAKVLQTILAYYGIEIREDHLIKLARTNKSGTPVKGIVKAAQQYRLKCIAKPMTITEVKKFLDRKIPVILLLQAWTGKKKSNWEKDWIDGHYVVAIGYKQNTVIFEDPYSFKLTYLQYQELEQRWHDIDKRGNKYLHQGIAIYGKKPAYNSHKLIHMG